MKEIEIVEEYLEKYRYGEHEDCDKCICKESCKMRPLAYGCALTKNGELVGFVK